MPPQKLVQGVRYLAHAELREGQIGMINDGFNTMGNGGFLLANAPTGIGKTAASLAASLSISRAHQGEHVLFLTGRQSQHSIVVDTVQKINANLSDGEIPIRLVDMIGREAMCEHVDRTTGKCSCEQGNSENEKANLRAQLRDVILERPMHVDDMIDYARKRRICAWATARMAATDADILVCDYNHLFLENVRKASLGSMGIEMERTIVIVDEAHNLPDRIRRSLSRNLNHKIIRDSIAELEEYCEENEKKRTQTPILATGITRARACEKALRKFKNRFSKWTREMRDLNSNSRDLGAKIEVKVDAAKILDMLREEIQSVDEGDELNLHVLISQLELVEVDTEEDEELACDRLAQVIGILQRYSMSPAMCVVFYSNEDEHRVTTHLLDPSIVSERVFETVHSGILMSGTLTPPEMYKETLGIPEERATVCASYPSPFLADRRPVMIASDVTSKYTARGESNTRKIREHIRALLKNTPGNVAVFCQSYQMLEEVVIDADWPEVHFRLEEERTWTKRDVVRKLQMLKEKRQSGHRVLVAGVFGGRLSEGVDYSNNILDAVICVGIPIAPQTVPQTSLREYIDNKHGQGKGWKYGVIQPAVNSVLQGMGRAIRKAEDRAYILLLDNRLLSGQYRSCLPSTMDTFTADSAKQTARMVKRFFSRFPEPAKGN